MRLDPDEREKDLKTRVSRLRSDLRDSLDPRIVAKYPHLGRPEVTAFLKEEIERLEKERGL